MTEANYPQDWVRTLSAEAARWVDDGLISEEQRGAILKRYPVEAPEARDRTVFIISILGSLLVGAGVVLFFAANWAVIPAVVKVATIITATVGAYGAGYYLQFVKADYPRLGHSLILMGSLFYGSGIWLIAQIFHLESRYPNGFFLWALGVIPVAWAASSVPVLYLATGLLGIWTVMEQTMYTSYNALFPLLALGLVVPMSRRLKTVLAEAAVLVLLFVWFLISIVRTDLEPMVDHEAVVLARALLLYGSAVLTLGLGRIGDPRAYLGVGSLAALGGLYALTFSSGRVENPMPDVFTGSPFLMIGLVVFLAVTLAGLAFYWRRAEAGRLPFVAAVVALLVAAGVAHLIPEIPRMVVFNVLLFTGTIGLVVVGIQRRSELLINLGLAAFLIHVFTRYVDLFFSALERSVFFIVGGILLLGGGWLLERNRRRWIGDWGGEGK